MAKLKDKVYVIVGKGRIFILFSFLELFFPLHKHRKWIFFCFCFIVSDIGFLLNKFLIILNWAKKKCWYRGGKNCFLDQCLWNLLTPINYISNLLIISMSDNCSENYACFPLQTGCDDDLQASSPWWYR